MTADFGTRRLVLAALTGLWALSSLARAEDAALGSLDTADDVRGWDGVGRLILGDHGFCSGALIAPQLVLTAGHCLYDRVTGVQMPLEDIEFQASFRNGRALAYRKVARAVAHPDYRFSAKDSLDTVSSDMALLELSQPILLPSLQPFDTGATPVEGDKVAVVSYAQYREDAPSIQEGCDVLVSEPEAMVLTCSVDFGSSGAPVFSTIDGVVRIVGVISAKAEADGKKVALAVPVAGALAALEAALEASRQGAAFKPKGVTVLSGGVDIGAKFVSP